MTMDLRSHKTYNSPNKIADLMIAADGDMKQICAALGQDRFNGLEIACLTGAYRRLCDETPNPERNMVIRALKKAEQQSRTPFTPTRPLTMPRMPLMQNLREQSQAQAS